MFNNILLISAFFFHAAFLIVSNKFIFYLKSTLLIVLLKAGKLVKLTEVGRLFHALMTLLAKKVS